MKIIAVYSIKGGVGKTTTAVNFAYMLSQQHNDTLLIDLDPQGASSYYLRVQPSKKLKPKKLLKAEAAFFDNIKASDYEQLDILASNLSFRSFDLMLDQIKSKDQLKHTLSSLESHYDYLVLDTPPNLTLLSENIFQAADVILVPVIPTTLSARTLDQLYVHFQKNPRNRSKLRPFFSMVQSKNQLHTQMMKKLRELCPDFLDSAIFLTNSIEHMGVQRAPVMEFAMQTPSASAYQALFQEVMSKLK